MRVLLVCILYVYYMYIILYVYYNMYIVYDIQPGTKATKNTAAVFWRPSRSVSRCAPAVTWHSDHRRLKPQGSEPANVLPVKHQLICRSMQFLELMSCMLGF